MGNFYVNYTLRGPSPEAVAIALTGNKALVTSKQNGSVVAFDELSDDQDQGRISHLGESLSASFKCPVLAVLNHDDDILIYFLFENGALTDSYNSAPGYFDPSAQPGPEGGDASRICTAFEFGERDTVENILRKSAFEDGGYTFEFERHEALVKALRLPDFSVGFGFANLAANQFPEGLSEKDIIRVL